MSDTIKPTTYSQLSRYQWETLKAIAGADSKYQDRGYEYGDLNATTLHSLDARGLIETGDDGYLRATAAGQKVIDDHRARKQRG
jgi:hypothetical protein